MKILINNAVLATQIFSGILALALIASARKKTKNRVFLPDLTQELKGLAILAVIFAHLGYFLASDQRFLWPLSIAGGIGVNLFLFLSGYGLVLSALAKRLTIGQFYKRRLLKLYQPLWLVLILFLILDFFILQRNYSLTYILQSFLGFFKSADLGLDLNSPLWYFTLIAFYYLLFPLFFSRKRPYMSALGLYLIGYAIVSWDPRFLSDVMRLYRVHILAFPLGVLVGALTFNYRDSTFEMRLKLIWQKIDAWHVLKKISRQFLRNTAYWLAITILLAVIAYNAYYSHVDGPRYLEEGSSLIAALAIVLLFLIKRFESRLLYLFGLYSYEIYLLHWPLVSRFDIFYRFIPAWLATSLYLLFFLASAWLMQQATKRIKLIK